MSVLLIDLGNTRLKWQLRSAGSVLQQGVGDYDDRLTEKLPEADKVLIAAVRAHPESRRLLEQKYPEKVCWLNEPLDEARDTDCEDKRYNLKAICSLVWLSTGTLERDTKHKKHS